MRRKRLNCITDYDNLFNDNSFISNSFEINDILSDIVNWSKDELLNFYNLNSNDALFITNINGNILYVNQKWTDICKYKSSDVIGKKFDILQSTKTDYDLSNSFNKILHNENKAEMTNINYDKYGNEIELNIKAHKINKNNNNIINAPYFIGTINLL